jgi:hypothetical protein
MLPISRDPVDLAPAFFDRELPGIDNVSRLFASAGQTRRAGPS